MNKDTNSACESERCSYLVPHARRILEKEPQGAYWPEYKIRESRTEPISDDAIAY